MGVEHDIEAVTFDFYGTLARATRWLSIETVVEARGSTLSEDVKNRWWNEGIDGIEHLEHSASRDRYVAWQRDRLLGMLAETDVHPGEYDAILAELAHGNATRVLEAYDESAEVLTALRATGLRLAICSNWDWDLADAVHQVGLATPFDVMVSSAWAGARKPHPRIFEAVLDELGVAPERIVFVGDTWGPDVIGPRAMGMRPLYLQRDGHWPDPTMPGDVRVETLAAQGVATATDLHGVLELVTGAGVR